MQVMAVKIQEPGVQPTGIVEKRLYAAYCQRTGKSLAGGKSNCIHDKRKRYYAEYGRKNSYAERATP